jgi:uncharacterized protein YjaZ
MYKINKNIFLHILNASGKFEPWTGKIVKTSRDCLSEIGSKIPINNTDIVFYNNKWSVVEGKGVTGRSIGAHTVFISFNFETKDMDNTITKVMPRTLAHELHHVARYRSCGRRKTLLDELVAEGLAGHFVIEVFGGEPEPWFNAIRSEDLNKLMKLYKINFSKPNNSSKWFFGDKNEKIPKWAGYTIGFEIIRKYLKTHPKKKVSNLYQAASDKFI